mgnify:CR=1 FL=1|tara:strand:- start:2616 stop:3545 length:930 start_codon:yes stop_codon:yes gene_type:complete
MNKKIVFMGTPAFAIPVLKSLYQNGYSISVVYTQPPQKSNRGYKINKSPVHIFSENLNFKIRTPYSFQNNEEEKVFLKNLQPDLVIVVAYGQLMPTDILKLSKNGFINIHASLLPKWRGAAPIQRSIMNFDYETGISIMKINEKLDQGPIYASYSIAIKKNENAEDLSKRLAALASEKILSCIEDIFENKAIFKEQDHTQATYAKKIKKIEGKLSWKDSAEINIGKINGLYPFPGAWFEYDGKRYKLLKAEFSNNSGKPGIILSDNFEIGCSENSIKVLQIQREGKNPQNIREFMLGTQIKKGTDLNYV